MKNAANHDALPVVTAIGGQDATNRKDTRDKKDAIDKKRTEEQKVVSLMFKLYCRHYHTKERRGGETLCEECKKDLDYAIKRSQHCPRMEEKSFCAFCPKKCYSPAMSEKISKVMKFAGPRLLLRKPSAVFSHVIQGIKEKRRRVSNDACQK